MDAREGFRRVARLSAWTYWIIAAICIYYAYDSGATVYRQTFQFAGEDGRSYSVDAYTVSAANLLAYRESHSRPHTTERFPGTVYLTTKEPQPHDYAKGYKAAIDAVGVSVAIYAGLWAIFRALRWVGSGFFPERPRQAPDLAGE